MRSSSTIPTDHGRRYMIQLCKHFGHRVQASFDDREGRIAFETGEVRLRASPDNLMVVAEAGEDEGLSRLERVVESHLRRFAFREPGLAVDWRRAG